jgi:hypothetical protein
MILDNHPIISFPEHHLSIISEKDHPGTRDHRLHGYVRCHPRTMIEKRVITVFFWKKTFFFQKFTTNVTNIPISPYEQVPDQMQ